MSAAEIITLKEMIKKLVQRLCIASIAFCNEMSQVEVARLHEAQV